MAVRTDRAILGDIELAWACGLFAGEGCATTLKDKRAGRNYLVLTISMYDKRCLDRFAKAISPYVPGRKTWKNQQGALVRSKGINKWGHEVWVCRLAGDPAAAVAEVLLVFLKGTDKGDQIERVMAGSRNPPRCYARKLTSQQVKEIRRRYANGWSSQRALAVEFGITQSTVWSIIHRKVWQ